MAWQRHIQEYNYQKEQWSTPICVSYSILDSCQLVLLVRFVLIASSLVRLYGAAFGSLSVEAQNWYLPQMHTDPCDGYSVVAEQAIVRYITPRGRLVEVAR
jgi:hypothetical protein